MTKKKAKPPQKYRGDTPAKRVARLVYWETVKSLMGSKFLTKPHVVLLSKEAGDVSCLKGFGVHPGHIIGVDTDKHAAVAAKHKHPDVACYVQDVASRVKHMRMEGKGKIPGSVFLDICAPMRARTMNTVASVANNMDTHGVLGVGFLAGREIGDWGEKIEKTKAKMSFRCGNRSFFIRSTLFFQEINKLTRPHGTVVLPIKAIYYASHGEDRFGKPMILCIGVIGKEAIRFRQPPAQVRQDPVDRASVSIAGVEHEHVTATPLELGALAGELESQGRSATYLLNASKKSVTAWKAHYTRGTY